MKRNWRKEEENNYSGRERERVREKRIPQKNKWEAEENEETDGEGAGDVETRILIG